MKSQNYKDVAPYIIFGILTTIVNVVVYCILVYFFKFHVLGGTVLAWIISVMFSYLTSRKWVFESNISTKYGTVKELFSFFLCRFITGVIDWGCMFVFVDLFNYCDLSVKIIVNIVVVICNYFASKFIVFK